MFRAQMRAISPVIATIIIVAVTIAIAVAVAGWLMGLWTGYTAKPVLEIIDTNLTVTSNGATLNVTVYNDGSATAKIIRVTAGGYDCTGTLPYELKPKQTVTLNLTCTGNFVPGSSYQIVVLTASGIKAVTTTTAH